MTLPHLGSLLSRHKKLAIAILIAVALAAAFAVMLRDKPLAVVLVAVERGTVEASVSNTRAGTVNACRRAKMSPSAGGQIARLHVKKGDQIGRAHV